MFGSRGRIETNRHYVVLRLRKAANQLQYLVGSMHGLAALSGVTGGSRHCASERPQQMRGFRHKMRGVPQKTPRLRLERLLRLSRPRRACIQATESTQPAPALSLLEHYTPLEARGTVPRNHCGEAVAVDMGVRVPRNRSGQTHRRSKWRLAVTARRPSMIFLHA
jgi:hypothetical protein